MSYGSHSAITLGGGRVMEEPRGGRWVIMRLTVVSSYLTFDWVTVYELRFSIAMARGWSLHRGSVSQWQNEITLSNAFQKSINRVALVLWFWKKMFVVLVDSCNNNTETAWCVICDIDSSCFFPFWFCPFAICRLIGGVVQNDYGFVW